MSWRERDVKVGPGVEKRGKPARPMDGMRRKKGRGEEGSFGQSKVGDGRPNPPLPRPACRALAPLHGPANRVEAF